MLNKIRSEITKNLFLILASACAFFSFHSEAKSRKKARFTGQVVRTNSLSSSLEYSVADAQPAVPELYSPNVDTDIPSFVGDLSDKLMGRDMVRQVNRDYRSYIRNQYQISAYSNSLEHLHYYSSNQGFYATSLASERGNQHNFSYAREMELRAHMAESMLRYMGTRGILEFMKQKVQSRKIRKSISIVSAAVKEIKVQRKTESNWEYTMGASTKEIIGAKNGEFSFDPMMIAPNFTVKKDGFKMGVITRLNSVQMYTVGASQEIGKNTLGATYTPKKSYIVPAYGYAVNSNLNCGISTLLHTENWEHKRSKVFMNYSF